MKDIYSTLNEALVLVFNLILKSEEKFIRNLGVHLSMSEVHTIDAIGDDTEKTMGEVASSLNITLGTLTTSINNLEKKGFVARSRSEKDKRLVFVSLTDEGKKVIEKHNLFHNNMISDIVTNLSTNEEYALVKALDNLIEYFMEQNRK